MKTAMKTGMKTVRTPEQMLMEMLKRSPECDEVNEFRSPSNPKVRVVNVMEMVKRKQ